MKSEWAGASTAVLIVEHDPEAGATGYLLADGASAEIARALAQARNAVAPISPAVARHIVSVLHAPAPPSAQVRREVLTPRERQILSLLVGGHAYAAIADALAIGLG